MCNCAYTLQISLLWLWCVGPLTYNFSKSTGDQLVSTWMDLGSVPYAFFSIKNHSTSISTLFYSFTARARCTWLSPGQKPLFIHIHFSLSYQPEYLDFIADSVPGADPSFIRSLSLQRLHVPGWLQCRRGQKPLFIHIDFSLSYQPKSITTSLQCPRGRPLFLSVID